MELCVERIYACPIPIGHMARVNEYKSTILYLLSEASSYMTGSTMIVDGGRTCW